MGSCGVVEGLVAEEVGDGDLGGGDEPVVAVLIDAGLVGAFVVAVEEVFARTCGSWPVPKRDLELTM